MCFCCCTLAAQLGARPAPVATVFGYAVGDRMHRLLRAYKDGPPPLRTAQAHALARRVDGWLATLGRGELPFGGWDVVTVVPSSRRPGAPAEAIAALVPALSRCLARLLDRGPDPTGHLRAARTGFRVVETSESTPGRHSRVLVFDDTLTTGARAQSAAFALSEGGFRVAGILAVGRVQRPGVGGLSRTS